MNCAQCPEHCCGKLPVTPILLPHEVGLFGSDDMVLDGQVYRLAKTSEGVCKFLTADKRCSIYRRRPFECRIYPWVMEYDATARRVDYVLHEGCFDRLSAPPPPSVPFADEAFWVAFSQAAL